MAPGSLPGACVQAIARRRAFFSVFFFSSGETAQRRLPTHSARSPASRRLNTTGQRLQRRFDLQHLRFALTTRDFDPAPATVPS